MLDVTGKYISVFEVVDKGKYCTANLSTPKLNKDNTYSYMYWKARFVGKAYENAKDLKDKDRIEITNGIIENNYDKEKEKLWVTVTIFEFDKMK